MKLEFLKMQGCGNDFLFLDDMGDHIPDFQPAEIRFLCDRHFGLGADGLVILRRGDETDVKWTFHNCDGSVAEMCGNAARCAIRFLHDNYPTEAETLSLETLAGVIRGRVLEDGRVEITLLPDRQDSFSYEEKVLEADGEMYQVYFTNTGVPHAVIEVKQLRHYPVAAVGSRILNHPAFAPEKTNVTFFQRTVGNRILSTTFERGVEQETMACGTGAAAAAIVFSELYLEQLPVEVVVPGGELTVDLSPVSRMLLLQGPADYVAKMEIEELSADFKSPERYGGPGGKP